MPAEELGRGACSPDSIEILLGAVEVVFPVIIEDFLVAGHAEESLACVAGGFAGSIRAAGLDRRQVDGGDGGDADSAAVKLGVCERDMNHRDAPFIRAILRFHSRS